MSFFVITPSLFYTHNLFAILEGYTSVFAPSSTHITPPLLETQQPSTLYLYNTSQVPPIGTLRSTASNSPYLLASPLFIYLPPRLYMNEEGSFFAPTMAASVSIGTQTTVQDVHLLDGRSKVSTPAPGMQYNPSYRSSCYI